MSKTSYGSTVFTWNVISKRKSGKILRGNNQRKEKSNNA